MHVNNLWRRSPLYDRWTHHQELVRKCVNSDYECQQQDHPEFEPGASTALVDDLKTPDFYTTATGRILGREPRDKVERDELKRVILATFNSQGAESLAESLKVSTSKAAEYLKALDRAYPELAAFKHLMSMQAAYTGQTESFAGRPRIVTPQKWLVTEPKLEVFITYKSRDRLWLEIIPLKPSLRVLVCLVLRVWDFDNKSKNHGKLIYHHERGRISSLPYRIFEDTGLLYRLPIRGIAWRSIRRVRTSGEWAFYQGFDRTNRMLFNHIAQGSTSDVMRVAMLRAAPVTARFDARLLLQIHDELVFEVPTEKTQGFTAAMASTLQEPPVTGFAVPILVEAKEGKSFGEMNDVDWGH